MKLKRLVITGGHPTPALAVIDEIREEYPDVSITFVGRRYVNHRETANSLEYQEIFARKIPFIHLAMKRGLWGLLSLPWYLSIALRILHKTKPDAILSFGGYVSVPICIAGYIFGVPIFLHEQTMIPGTANMWLAHLATRVMVSFPDTVRYFDKRKVLVTGNPLRKKIFISSGNANFAHLRKPIILVIGGNLGSHSINHHIFQLLFRLLADYSVIHQVGNVKEYHDWDKAQEAHIALPRELRERYHPMQHLATHDMAEVYKRADIVISRSGASTVTELIALRKPAVLIPLPWSARGEQEAHARLLSQAHVAEIFDQNHSSDELLSCIQKIGNNVQSYAANYDSLTTIYDPQAAKKILRTILETLSAKS